MCVEFLLAHLKLSAHTRVIFLSRTHAITRSKCNTSIRSRLLVRCKCNLPPPRRVHLFVIRMPIASLKNDCGHELCRCVAVRHNAIPLLLLVAYGGKSSRNRSVFISSVFIWICIYMNHNIIRTYRSEENFYGKKIRCIPWNVFVQYI